MLFEVALVYNYKDFPEVGEYVIITISNINPNSAFARLDEYKNRSGMIHISEVASTWIKDIRKYLSVGNKRVAKVISVDSSRGHVNLSLKRVKPTTEREKKTEWKNEKKAENLFSMVAKEMGMNLSQAYEKVGFGLQEKYGLMYAMFEVAATEGASALVQDGVSQDWAEKIEGVAKKSIKPKVVTIKGVLEVKSYESDGIEIIKRGFALVDSDKVEVAYINAPNYSFRVTSGDYRECEKILKDNSDKVIGYIIKNGGEAVLHREK